MSGQLRTARWNALAPIGERAVDDKDFRLLVTRFRPRGVAAAKESWDGWMPELAPSASLVKSYRQDALPWEIYRPRYLAEMAAQRFRIAGLAGQLVGGDGLVLLCSSSCFDRDRCHRTLLAQLIDEARVSR